jgi:hypothetical protein
MFEKRIIIGGLPRAGTTLFRFVLDASLTIVCGPETAFFTQPLSISQNRLERTAARLERVLEIDRALIEQAICDSTTTFEAFDRIMQAYCETIGVCKTIWAEKTPFNCSMYHSLALEMSGAYFISLIRDGRDVLTSVIDGRVEYHVSMQRYVETLRYVYGFEHDRHLVVRYEEMVADPERCFRRTFEFLDLPFTAESLQRYRQASASRDLTKVNQSKVQSSITTQWIGRWRQPEHAARVREMQHNSQVMHWLEKSGYGSIADPASA